MTFEALDPRAERRLPGELALLVLVALYAAWFTWARVHYNIVFLHGAIENVAFIDPRGAATPFQYRVLTPRVVRFLQEHVAPFASVRQVFHVIDAVSLVAAFYVLRRLARELLGSTRLALAVALGLLVVLPLHYVLSRRDPVWYAWDMTSLLAFTYGLWLQRARNWKLYYPLFALATFNRETICFLTVAHVLTHWREGARGRVLLHALAQTAIWFAVKALLWRTYHRQPGNDFFQSAVAENCEILMDPKLYPLLAMSFGGLWLPLILFWRHIREPWIRRVTLVVPIFVGGMFFAGVLTELRIWGELIPIVLLGATAALRGRFGAELNAPARPQAEVLRG